MTAQDYSVEFAYGATEYPWYYTPTAAQPKNSKWLWYYHRGDDRYTPTGTPVVVNGVQIGLTGATGAVSGPHIHIGRFVNGTDTNPNGGGFTLNAPVTVTTVGYSANDGNFIRLTDGDGVQWIYDHLSRQDVTQGQELKGEDMAEKITQDTSRILYWAILGLNGVQGRPYALNGQNDGDALVGRELTNDLIQKLYQGETSQQWRDVVIPQINDLINQAQKPNADAKRVIADIQAVINKYS